MQGTQCSLNEYCETYTYFNMFTDMQNIQNTLFMPSTNDDPVQSFYLETNTQHYI